MNTTESKKCNKCSSEMYAKELCYRHYREQYYKNKKGYFKKYFKGRPSLNKIPKDFETDEIKFYK